MAIVMLWTSRRVHATTVSPTKTCFTHYDIIGELSKLAIPRSRCSSGPSRTAEPLEVGVVSDDEGTAVIHAMRARGKFLEGWWIE